MTPKAPRGSRARGLGRVLLYYVIFGVVLALLVRYVPSIREVVAGVRLDALGSSIGDSVFGPQAPPPVGSAVSAGPWSGAIVAALSMIGALTIMVPVTWVYMVTRRHRGYDESVVHTLLILPVAVTGIVMIVQNSIPLAFSLAGIVAAVRFRTTLDDTKDAVYVFLAIGVGLATGVQALGIAVTLSVIFNVVVLVLWQTRFGNIYADQNTRAGPLSVGDVVAGPGSAHTALRVGDPAVLEAAAPKDLADIAERAVRIERHLSDERSKSKRKRANTLVLVHAGAAGPAQAHVEELLERVSVRWKLAEIGPGPEGHLLIYVVRLDDPAAAGTLMDGLREGHGGAVTAAELRSLQGLKARV
jgi:hypothetical protein